MRPKLLARMLLAAFHIGLASEVTAAEKLPVEAFAQLPFVERAAISPSGNHIAGIFGIHGAQVIGLLSLVDTKEHGVSVAIPDGAGVNFVRWVNEDNILIGVEQLVRVEDSDWYVSRCFGVNRQTGKITKLLPYARGQNAADIVWAPSNGSSEVLISAQNSVYTNEPDFWPAVYRVDVANGRESMVVRPQEGVMTWLADATGVVRAGVAYSDQTRTSRYYYRTDPHANFHTLEVGDARKHESILKPFLFLPGNHALIVCDNKQGMSSIYEMDLGTLDIVDPLYEPAAGEVDDLVFSGDRSRLLGVTTTAVGGGIYWLDPKLADLQQQFNKALPASMHATIESINSDSTRMLVRADAADMPGILYLYDVNDGTLRKIALINDAIGLRHLAPVKAITYQARDGLGIEAVLTLPQDREPHDLPLIMMPHGGPWGQDTLSYDYWAQFLASRGYAVLQPNYRGSTGYGTAFLRKGEGQLGLQMQDDLTDGVNWAVSHRLPIRSGFASLVGHTADMPPCGVSRRIRIFIAAQSPSPASRASERRSILSRRICGPVATVTTGSA